MITVIIFEAHKHKVCVEKSMRYYKNKT